MSTDTAIKSGAHVTVISRGDGVVTAVFPSWIEGQPTVYYVKLNDPDDPLGEYRCQREDIR